MAEAMSARSLLRRQYADRLARGHVARHGGLAVTAHRGAFVCR